ncbi:hypothetical protein [Hydrogenophaga sp. PAMC20947]|uniref:hypothetical protein n=1 Tax=Hydrogenophaga sp. PAMC20947 TaxID=2565558 RepID=UPI00109DA7BE|nr:hypothetical protein [Hydrogenophaga sp. PAMC20947]QCB45431.1 hypothetical protein E5678_04960 [Hydrogenophaga sp. PAMC20947]
MKAKDLASVWGSPDNSRLTAKQSSFRLPVHVAAKLAALAEMYPQKTKTQMVADLLSAALTDLESGLPAFPGEIFPETEDGEQLYEAAGPAQLFRTLTNKFYAELEMELGNETPEPFYKGSLLVTRDGK